MNTIRKGRAWWLRIRATQKEWLPHGKGRHLAVAVAVWLAVSAIFVVTLFSHRIDVTVGDLAPRNVFAPYGVVDWGATQKAREQAANAVAPVYMTDPAVLNRQKQMASNDFLLIDALAADDQVPLATREAAAEADIPLSISPDVWGRILTASPARLAQLRQDALVVLSSVMGTGNGIRNNAVGMGEAKSFVSQLAAQEESDPALRTFLATFTQSLVAPNTFVNQQDTAARRRAAAARVPLVKILKGEQVLQQGQVVTAGDINVLRQVGLLDQGLNLGPIVGSLVFAAVLVGLNAGYLWIFHRKTLETKPVAIITGLVLVVALAAADILAVWPALGYLIVPTAAMMLTTLLDAGMGLVMAGVLSVAIAVLTGADLNAALVAFFGGVAGVFGVSRLSRRYDIMGAGVLVGGVNLLALVALDIMESVSLTQAPVWQGLAWGLVDGILSAIIVTVTMPILEGLFGVVTAIKLIELSNPNQPLLRKLSFEAPGTFSHSMWVGALAEAAAEAVGGNSLLARVGAYYHDIGKAKRPYFFIDNQFGGENPHDKLSPSLSALIIASHVRDGVELAKEYRIPEAIIHFIREHHGTTLIRYFYHKAQTVDTGDGVIEEDFRYDGPKPQTKETAIVMLADASEATARTLKSVTAPAIEDVVRRVIQDRLQDGQLDESNLTLKELDVVARTFTRILIGMFHQRIEYPEQVLKEMERSRKRGHMGGQSARLVRRVGRDGSSGGPHSAR